VAVHPSDARYAPIVGMLCEIPVGPKEHRRLIPIITDEYPDPAFGSGAVKITGAHDFNDYGVAKRAGIPCYRLMDTRAQMRADGAPYAEAAAVAQAVARGERVLSEAEADALNLVPDHLRGLDRFEARKRVVEEITAEGLAVMTRADDPRLGRKLGAEDDPAAPVPLVEAKAIMQPFGDRSKVVIEPMLTDQWFVDAEKIVGPALDAVRQGRTVILPESGEKTYYHWLENIEPWCISRQLWWGHQIPVWYGPDGEQFCAANEKEACEAAAAHYALKNKGKNVSINADDDDLSYQRDESGRLVAAPNELQVGQADGYSGGDWLHINLTRDPDVLDTWFSSGLWPIGTLGWPEDTKEMRRYFPTSVLVTGQDILFFWVARMMMMQLAVVNDIPFRTVYLHGLVRDARGKKMSKSLGNVIDPLEIIDEYGADALRFANAAMASLGGVLKLDTQRIAGYRNFGTKLWNATRFAEMNGVFAPDVPAPGPTPPPATATANRWILGETARTRAAVDAALGAYRFNEAADALYRFVWGSVCDWYVEFAKPLMEGDQAAETRAVMRWVIDQCLILLHPIMPFITEELWGLTGARAKMCVHADWPAYGPEIADPAADREMGWVIGLIEGVRSARAQLRVPVGLKLPMLALDQTPEAQAAYARNAALIERLARLEGLHPVAGLPKGAVTVALDGATYALPLEGVIDAAAELGRLAKALEKLEKDLAGLNARLGNPRFLASAGEEVVDETRAQAAEKADEAGRIRAALDLLRAMV
jgi:valyl-tRNA synthetase